MFHKTQFDITHCNIYILYTYHTNMAGGYTHVLWSSLFELMNWKITCFDGYINDKPPIFQFDMFVYQRVSHFLKPVAGFTFSLGKLWWSWLGRPWHIHRVSDAIWCHENENLMWNALDHELRSLMDVFEICGMRSFCGDQTWLGNIPSAKKNVAGWVQWIHGQSQQFDSGYPSQVWWHGRVDGGF